MSSWNKYTILYLNSLFDIIKQGGLIWYVNYTGLDKQRAEELKKENCPPCQYIPESDGFQSD